jgi:mRNA-degrading endonuclease RelE of RelBE toxin-antitoxin system
MSFEVIATGAFEKQLKHLGKKYKSLTADLKPLFDALESNPYQGILISGNCYKIRIAIKSKGKGKSAGARVITCVKETSKIVYLVAIYDKSDKDTLTDNELEQLIRYLT